MLTSNLAMVLSLVDDMLWVFNADAERESFGFDQNILALQHLEYIAGGMTCCQNNRVAFDVVTRRRFYTFYFIELNI